MRRINVAMILTVGRLFLAPVFALAYACVDIWPSVIAVRSALTAMWVLLLVMELTDVLDGTIARRQGLVTDLGKVLDPFADVFCRLTYFVILTVAGVTPLWFVLVVLYRELIAVFLRLLFARGGYALAAGSAGKLKSWFYGLSAVAGLFILTIRRIPDAPAGVTDALPVLEIVAICIFAISAVLAVWSIAGYLRFYIRKRRDAA